MVLFLLFILINPYFQGALKNIQFCSRSRKTIRPKAALSTENLLYFKGYNVSLTKRMAKGRVVQNFL